MTKRTTSMETMFEQWKQESIEQAIVRLTLERFTELQRIVRVAGQVH